MVYAMLRKKHIDCINYSRYITDKCEKCGYPELHLQNKGSKIRNLSTNTKICHPSKTSIKRLKDGMKHVLYVKHYSCEFIHGIDITSSLI